MPAKKKSATIEKLTPDAVAKLINDRFGEGTMTFASDPDLKITRIPTGILSIDSVIGGGFARGRHVELYGDNSTGKTACALRTIASAQKLGLNAAFVDAERTFDPKWAKHLGVKLKKLAYHKQKSGPQCVDFIESLLYSEAFDVIVLDSIASLLPKAERDSSMEDGSMGTEQAKMMSKALRKLTTANNKTVMIFINQTREAVGTVFGNRMITSGGKAMGFYAGLRLEFVTIETLKRPTKIINMKTGADADKDTAYGHRVQVTVRKDKTGGARPQETTTFVYNYDMGNIDPIEDFLYVGRRAGAVLRSGDHWWVDGYADERQLGRKKFKKWLKQNVAVQEDLTEMIKKANITTGGDDD